MQKLLFIDQAGRMTGRKKRFNCQYSRKGIKKNVRTVRFRTLTYYIKSARIIQWPGQRQEKGALQ